MPFYIPRTLRSSLAERLALSRKILIVYGPRQVGKTTLIRRLIETYPGTILQIDADQGTYQETLSSRSLQQLKLLVSGYNLVFIDEAQRIPNIGINLKIIHDQIPEVQIIATGSSSFELANQINESLTGRTWTYTLYPISISEWAQLENPFQLNLRLDEFLQYGMYPEVFSFPNAQDKKEYLLNLTQSYLYKDVLDLGGIRHANKIKDLLRLLAYQIGSLVSFNELGKSLGLSTDTVIKYIDLLEKAFVLKSVSGYSRNLRKEIVKNKKIYFVDLGIRNAIIENFNPPHSRPDKGAMWENFLILERHKLRAYERLSANFYFWRTYTGAELDYVEETGGKLYGFEFKWGNRGAKVPKTWQETYPEAQFQFINRDNYLDFLTLPPDGNA